MRIQCNSPLTTNTLSLKGLWAASYEADTQDNTNTKSVKMSNYFRRAEHRMCKVKIRSTHSYYNSNMRLFTLLWHQHTHTIIKWSEILRTKHTITTINAGGGWFHIFRRRVSVRGNNDNELLPKRFAKRLNRMPRVLWVVVESRTAKSVNEFSRQNEAHGAFRYRHREQINFSLNLTV